MAHPEDTLLDRLREVRCDREPFSPEHKDCICRLANEAADEIELLRKTLGDTARREGAANARASALEHRVRQLSN